MPEKMTAAQQSIHRVKCDDDIERLRHELGKLAPANGHGNRALALVMTKLDECQLWLTKVT